MIMYCPSKDNAKADILSQREQDVDILDEAKAHLRTRALLQLDQIDPCILDSDSLEI